MGLNPFTSGENEPKATMPNAALFAAHYLAACEVSGFPADIDARKKHLMNNWHVCRLFLSDVQSGADVRLYNEMVAANAARDAKIENQRRRDEEAERAQRERNVKEFGAKVPV